MLNDSFFSDLKPCINKQGDLDWGLWMNNERELSLAVGAQTPSLNKNLPGVSPCPRLLPAILFDCVLMRGHALLKSHTWLLPYEDGPDAEESRKGGVGGGIWNHALTLARH